MNKNILCESIFRHHIIDDVNNLLRNNGVTVICTIQDGGVYITDVPSYIIQMRKEFNFESLSLIYSSMLFNNNYGFIFDFARSDEYVKNKIHSSTLLDHPCVGMIDPDDEYFFNIIYRSMEWIIVQFKDGFTGIEDGKYVINIKDQGGDECNGVPDNSMFLQPIYWDLCLYIIANNICVRERRDVIIKFPYNIEVMRVFLNRLNDNNIKYYIIKDLKNTKPENCAVLIRANYFESIVPLIHPNNIGFFIKEGENYEKRLKGSGEICVTSLKKG